jgi:hypothetical protein
MRQFKVIGCSHSAEDGVLLALEGLLENLSPNQLILEIPDDADQADSLKWQSPEMVWAYHWAQRNGVPVRGYEPRPPMSILRAELGPDRIGELVEEIRRLGREVSPSRAVELYSKGSAPQTPTEERLKVLDEQLIDPRRAAARTQAIVENIELLAQENGVIVILCGSNHTPHIARALESCEIVGGEHFY